MYEKECNEKLKDYVMKPTRRQMKKKMRKETTERENISMCSFLEKKWKNVVHFSCGHCLKEAYESEVNDCQGYVTDEELIESSNYKLQHK